VRIALVLLLTALTGVLGLSSGNDLFLRLAYLLIFVLIGGWLWSRYALSGMSVDFAGSAATTTVGQKAWEQLTIYNDGSLPKFWLEVEQETDLPLRWPPHVMHLPSGQARTVRIEFLCDRRGRYTIGPTHVATTDPFGLFRSQGVLGGTHSIIVYPATVELQGFSLPPADLPGEGRYRRRTHFVTPNAAGIREYAYGDSYNRIHWPSTARTGKLMVKEFELDPASETWVILDLDARVQLGEGLEGTEEYAVTTAASVAKRYLDANRPIGLLAYGSNLTVRAPDRGAHQLAHIMESLALAKASGRVALAELLTGEARRFGRFSTLLVITPSCDETWVHQLQRLMRRGARAAVVLLEPATFGGGDNTLLTMSALLASGVQTYLVKRGVSVQSALQSLEEVAAGSKEPEAVERS